MRHFLLTLLLLVGLFVAGDARTLTAATSGSWETATTWSPAAVPANNDVVIIPGGKTVTISNNINQKTSFMEVRVAGTLEFVGGGAKLWLNSLSMVYVYPSGKIIANQNSQVITLGTTTVLAVPNSGTTTVTGPTLATASSPSASSSSSTTGAAGFLPYSPSALPVTFLTFTATRQHNEVLVQWSTSRETGADRFEVELSTDGRNWTSHGSVAAAGNSSTVQNYSYTARNISGRIQVRIRQVDLDGKNTYTAIHTVQSETDAAVKVLAAAGRLQLLFPEEVKGATVRIVNLSGQVLQEQKFASANGQVSIPTAQKGLCIVTVVSETELLAAQKVIF